MFLYVSKYISFIVICNKNESIFLGYKSPEFLYLWKYIDFYD